MMNLQPFARVPATSNAVVRFGIIAQDIFDRAATVDVTASFPAGDLAALAAMGLLTAPLPRGASGEALATDVGEVGCLSALLQSVGEASLTVGRLFEGHCNAILLVERFGGAIAILAAEAEAGRISAVWNAQRGTGLTARRERGGWQLSGRKIHCSGAGSIARPLVTAQPIGEAGPLMMLVDMASAGICIDVTVWQAAGMRGTATGTVDFDNVFVADDAVVGSPGDYYKSPFFATGAWRVIAVQLGGMRRVLALQAAQLERNGRAGDAVVRHRFSAAAGAYEAARLIVDEAASRATDPAASPEATVAYVDLARSSFETLALTSIDIARRNAGLSAFVGPDPLDRCCRDLETYLRQPMIDASRDNAAAYLMPRGGVFE